MRTIDYVSEWVDKDPKPWKVLVLDLVYIICTSPEDREIEEG